MNDVYVCMYASQSIYVNISDRYGCLAKVEERWTENPKVGGSNLVLVIFFFKCLS